MAKLQELSPEKAERARKAKQRYDRMTEDATTLFMREVLALVDEGASVAALAREMGMTRQALHDRINRARSSG